MSIICPAKVDWKNKNLSPSVPVPPVEAKRRSRYRGPVAPEDGTGARRAYPIKTRLALSAVCLPALWNIYPVKCFFLFHRDEAYFSGAQSIPLGWLMNWHVFNFNRV